MRSTKVYDKENIDKEMRLNLARADMFRNGKRPLNYSADQLMLSPNFFFAGIALIEYCAEHIWSETNEPKPSKSLYFLKKINLGL